MKKVLFVLFAASVLFIGCKKQEEAVAPEATVPAATDAAAPAADAAAAPAAPAAPADAATK